MIRLLVLEPNPNLPVREVVRYLSRVRFLGLRAMPTFALDSAMSLSGLNVNFRHITYKNKAVVGINKAFCAGK